MLNEAMCGLVFGSKGALGALLVNKIVRSGSIVLRRRLGQEQRDKGISSRHQ